MLDYRRAKLTSKAKYAYIINFNQLYEKIDFMLDYMHMIEDNINKNIFVF